MQKPLWLLLVLASGAAAKQDHAHRDAPPYRAAFSIEHTASRLLVSGNVSSAAHEAILRNSVRRFFDADGGSPVRFSLTKASHAPPTWALVTDMALRAVSATRSAHAEITESSIRIRGVTANEAAWNSAILRLEAALPDGMALSYDVVSVGTAEPYATLCRRRFLQIARDNRIEFIRSGTDLASSAFPALDAIVEILVDCPRLNVRVVGHTDASGEETANIAQSQARADAVARYLVDRGLSRDRLETAAAGSSQPKAAGSDAGARRINRRVEFSLL